MKNLYKYSLLYVLVLIAFRSNGQGLTEHIFTVNDSLWFHAKYEVLTGEYFLNLDGNPSCPAVSDINLPEFSAQFADRRVVVFAPEGATTDLCGDSGPVNLRTGNYYFGSKVSAVTAGQSAYNTRINVSWDLLNFHNANADGYLLFRSDSDDNWTQEELDNPVAVLMGDVNQYDDNNLKFGTQYFYKVVGFNITSGSAWISAYSTSAMGSTSGADYAVTVFNEYKLQHNITVSYDVFSGFEKDALYFRITDQSLNQEVVGKESGLIDHISNDAYSLWDKALEAKGNATNGIYGTLPTQFTNGSGDWSLEMVLKIDELEASGITVLFSHGTASLLSIDNADQSLIIDGQYTSNTLPMHEWFNLSQVSESGVLKTYVNGNLFDQRNSSVTRPKYINGDGSHTNFVKNMDIGMVRAWKVARTHDQLIEDYLDLFTPQGTASVDMVNEWVMDDPAYADIAGLNNGLNQNPDGGVLSFTTSDVQAFEITWVDSFVLDNIDITIPYVQHVKPGTTHDFLMEIFEVGSGIRHTSVNVSATAAPAPVAQLNLDNTDKDTISLNFITASVAETFEIWRTQDYEPSTRVKLNTLEIEEINRGNVNVTVKDYYKFGSTQSIEGNATYTYEVIPKYAETAFDDTNATATNTQATLDLGLMVSVNTDDITLTWDQAAVASNFTDTIMVTRDGEIIARIIDQNTYHDLEITYGRQHTYGVHPVRDGQMVFGQYTQGQTAANGLVRGYFLDKRKDLIIENIEVEASANIEGASLISLNANQADGSFETSGIYYGESASYQLNGLSTATFELNRVQNNKTLFLKTDSLAPASEDQGIIHNLSWLESNHTDRDNVFSFRWYTEYKDDAVDMHDSAFYLYTNVYRNDKLIGVVRGGVNGDPQITTVTTKQLQCEKKPYKSNKWEEVTDGNVQGYDRCRLRQLELVEATGKYIEQNFTDSTGTAGEEYAYKFRTYYYDLAEQQFHYKDTLLSALYPQVTPISDLTAISNVTGDAVDLTFSYLSVEEAGVDHFEIFRSRMEAVEPTLIGTIESGNNTVFTDHTGVPGMDYTYTAKVKSGDNLSVSSNEVVYTYPEVSSYLTINRSDVLPLDLGDHILIEISGLHAVDDDGHYPFDGLVLFANNEAIDNRPVQDLLRHAVDPSVRFYQKAHYLGGNRGDDMSYDYAFYKTNEDGTFIIDRTNFGSNNSYQQNEAIPGKSPAALVGENFAKVYWSLMPAANGGGEYLTTRTVSTKLVSDVGDEIDVDPRLKQVVLTGDQLSKSWSLKEYDYLGNEVMSAAVDISGSTTASGTPGFQEITNLLASQDLTNEVFLSWEYEDFGHVEFEVYRNGIQLDLVSDHYYIDTAVPDANQLYVYQVRAVYDANNDDITDYFSSKATAAGMKRVPFVLEGHVYDSLGHGVPYIKLYTSFGEATQTDSTGYYRMDELYYTDGTGFDIGPNHFMNPEGGVLVSDYSIITGWDKAVTMTLAQAAPNIETNFVIDHKFELAPAVGHVTDAFALHAYANTQAHGVDLHIQLSQGRYHGVELYRGGMLIEDLDNTQDLIFTDHDGESGLDYSYSAIPYWLDKDGQKRYGQGKSANMIYPVLAPPGYLAATALNGEIELQWRDANTKNSYLIFRNEEMIAAIDEGGVSYLDESGLPGQTYLYKIYSARQQGGYTTQSRDYKLISVTYPYPAEVTNLQAVSNQSQNTTTLNWGYSIDANIVKAEVERNGKKLNMDEALPTTVIDTTGIPGIINTYKIITYRSGQEGAIPSPGSEIEVFYPDLPVIDNHIPTADAQTMTLKIAWDYDVKALDGFKVSVTKSGDSEPLVSENIPAVSGTTAYDYTFGYGVSGNNYKFDIEPYATRNGTVYKAPVYSLIEEFPVLPAPELMIAEQGDNYALITWSYEDFDLDEWEVTSPSAMTLPAGERSVLVTGTGSQYLTVRAEKSGGTASVSASQPVNLVGGASTTITATSQAYSVDLNIATGSSQEMKLYKDGVLLHTWASGGNQLYTDVAVNPGEQYLYKVVQNDKSAAVMGGANTTPDGQISGSVMSVGGSGVQGVTIRLSGVFDGRLITAEATSRQDGKYFFTGLPYGTDPANPTAYNITPVRSGRILQPAEASVWLSSFETTGSATTFIDHSSFTIAGDITYRWKSAQVPDLQAKLIGYEMGSEGVEIDRQESKNGEYSFSQIMSDQYLSYRVELDTEYHNASTGSSSAGAQGPAVANDYYYSYFEQEGGKTLSTPIATADLQIGETVRVGFTDTLLVQTQFEVRGVVGSLGNYRWKLRLRDKSGKVDTTLVTQPNGVLVAGLPPLNYEVQLIGVDRPTSLAEAVIAYFRPVIVKLSHQDSLKSFTDREGVKSDIYNDADDIFNTQVELVFHKVPEIDISGFDTSNCLESTDVFDRPVLAGPGDQNQKDYTLDFTVKEDYDGTKGDVTEGYLILVNNTLVDKVDTLRYRSDTSTPGWQKWNPVGHKFDGNYTFTAQDLNVVSPYTLLIEVHYFDANWKYLATALQEVIVTGMKNVGDSDFVTDPDITNFPLFVLRDPPGDASKATIEQGSSLKYAYNSKMAYSAGLKIEKEFKMSFFGLGTKFTGKLGYDQSFNYGAGYTVSLDLKEALSTSGGAGFDPDRRKYQLGRESDIIVGVGANLMYGVARKVQQDASDVCKISEEKIIAVDLANISTTWNYTVSEIERNIGYYDQLINDPKVSFENEDNNDASDPKANFTRIKQNWIAILEQHDHINRAPANMCRLAMEIHDLVYADDKDDLGEINEAAVAKGFIFGRKDQKEDVRAVNKQALKDIVGFCKGERFGNSDNKINVNLDFEEGDYVSRLGRKWTSSDDAIWGKKWGETELELYKKHAENFQEFWVRYQVYTLHQDTERHGDILDFDGLNVGQYDLDWIYDHYADDARFGDLAENRSFSAAASYTQTLTSTKSIAQSWAENFKTSVAVDITSEVKTSTANVLWGSFVGVGAGIITQLEEIKTSVSYKAGWSIATAFDLSQSETLGESLKISYTLNDNDPGDHFNTWILHDPTGYNYNTTPDFVLTAGKSSCPYEDGTIQRDVPQVKAIDSDGVSYPTTLHNLEWREGAYVLPIQLTNLAPFYETRKWAVMPARDGNTQGIKLTLGQEILVESAPKEVIHMYGEEPTYQEIHFGNYGSYNGFDFPNVHLIVGPKCEVNNGWVHPDVTDTLTLSLFFRRDISPISVKQADDWFISQEVSSWTFGIDSYRLDRRQYDLDKVWLEYRQDDDDNYAWIRMTNDEGVSELDRVFLQSYFDDFRNIYPEEYYPFVWSPDSTLTDGKYLVRAVVIHPDGEVSYSGSVSVGTIDRRAPSLSDPANPVDGILSRSDVIGFNMDETLDCDKFYEDIEDHVTVMVNERDGTAYRSLQYDSDPAFSEYFVSCSGSGLDLVIGESVLHEVDGKDIVVTVSGLTDRIGNIAEVVSWKFRADAFKYPVSAIRLNEPTVLLVNQQSSQTVDFIASEYELYGNNSVLDSIRLEYRKKGTDNYIKYDSRTLAQLIDSYETNGNVGLKPQDTLRLVTTDIEDGIYSFRFTAWGGGQIRTSNSINAVFDRVNPEIMNIVPVNRVLDFTDQIRITYSEKMYDRDGLTFTAQIGQTPFYGFNGFINSNWTGFSLQNASDPALFDAFGDTLSITINGLTDYYGNPLLNNVIKFVIGNFAPNVSGVKLHDPADWVMDLETQSITFMAGDYDLYGTKGKDLDSLHLVYHLKGTNDFVEIAGFTQSELQALDQQNHSVHAEPTIEISWDISAESTIIDGDYDVYAVAYGDNGKPYYSGASSGTIDRTAPWYTGIYLPSDDVFNDIDHFFSFKFSEHLDPFSGANITLSQMVNGTPVSINPSLYNTLIEGSEVKIIPSESFKVTYSNEMIEIYLTGLTDRQGNGVVDDHWIRIAMQDFGYLNAGSRQVTELDAERRQTGEIDVSWISYDLFDETMIERSRDGIQFVEIARYNGNISNHLDEINFSKLVFYRLKQTIDTTSYYSKVVAVETDNLIPLLVTHTYPMPFDGKAFRLAVMTNNLDNDLEIQIMSTTGMVVAQHHINAEVLNNLNVKIRFDEPLKPGIYHMQMIQGAKRSYQKLLVAH